MNWKPRELELNFPETLRIPNQAPLTAPKDDFGLRRTHHPGLPKASPRVGGRPMPAAEVLVGRENVSGLKEGFRARCVQKSRLSVRKDGPSCVWLMVYSIRLFFFVFLLQARTIVSDTPRHSESVPAVWRKPWNQPRNNGSAENLAAGAGGGDFARRHLIPGVRFIP